LENVPPTPEFKTDPNSFGVYRIYKSREPSFTPDDNFRVNSVADGPNFTKDPTSDTQLTWASLFGTDFTQPDNTELTIAHLAYLPFHNMSVFHLMQWFHDPSSSKSHNTLNNLVHQVLLALDFNANDLAGFDAAKEAKQLDDFNLSAPEKGTSASSSGSQHLNNG
jgi:hypothetical protein